MTDAYLTLGLPDSALAAARAAVVANPGNLRALENYARTLVRVEAPAWQRQLAAARLDQALGRLTSASARVDSAGWAAREWRPAAAGCWELEHSLPLMRVLKPSVALSAQSWVDSKCRDTVP
jgi:hypothetical protein